MRILLVSQMYPGRDTPDLGSFVATLEHALEARGHEIERAVVDRRGGRSRHAELAVDVLRTAHAFRPDVVYAHFLVPAGLLGALAGRAPLVVTAHGQDVENARRNRAVRSATAFTVRRAHAVVAVSTWLRDRLVEVVPEALTKSSVIDCGVDLERFALRDGLEARSAVGWSPAGTGFLCLGSLSERKNVLRLARAFEQRGEGELAFVGDGPLRSALEGRPRIHLAGAVAHEQVADVDRGRRRRLPAEPHRAVRALDARGPRIGAIGRGDARRRPAGVRPAGPACSSTRATTTRCGPASTSRHCSHGRTSRPGAPPRRTTSGGRRSGWRSFCFVLQPIEVGQPDLDERADGLLESRLPGGLERRLVARAHLVERHALLEPVVAGHEQVLDLRARVVRGVHERRG